MYNQINSDFVSLTKQFADSALKANSLALANFEQLVGLQLKTVESRVNATVAFFSEAAEVRDIEGARAIMPKGVNLVRESAEQFYGVTQEALGQTLKASEAIGTLVKGQFEAANEVVRDTANETVAKAARQGKSGK